MKKPRSCFFTVLLILFLLNIFIFSCKTLPLFSPLHPYEVVGDSFSLYTALDTHRDTKAIESILQTFLPNLSEKSQKTILSFTKTIYLGYSLENNSLSAFIEGNFPTLMKTQLSKKNGWEKKQYSFNMSEGKKDLKINYYDYDNDFSLAMISKNLILISNANIESLLENYFLSFTMQNNELLSQVNNSEKNPYTRLEKSIDDSKLLIYVKEPKEVLKLFLPFDADFALSQIFIHAKERENANANSNANANANANANDYLLDLDFVFSDSRAVRPALLLFNLAFLTADIQIEQIEENQIQVKGMEFSLENIFKLY